MERNLRDRIFTVVLGVSAVFAILFLVPQMNFILFSIFVIAICFAGSTEMSKILFGRVVLLAFLAPLLTVIQYIQGLFGFNVHITDTAFVFLLLGVFAVEIRRGESDSFKNSLDRASRSALLIIYPSYMLSFVLRLLALEGVNSYVILMYLLMAFGNDIFAYIFGRMFGKGNRGIIKVSPKKSIAGFVGSFFASIGIAFGFYFLFRKNLPYISVFYRTLLGAGVSISANLGDLIESVFKRSAGIKDSGNLFPGRGGALDSLDSEISSAPVFFLVFSLIMEAM